MSPSLNLPLQVQRESRFRQPRTPSCSDTARALAPISDGVWTSLNTAPGSSRRASRARANATPIVVDA